MRAEEFDVMKEVSMAAFGDDESIGVLLDALRASWAWHDELAIVAVLDGDVVGQVLYTSALLDAPRRLVDVLVLSPIGVRPDLQRAGIGGELIRRSIAQLAGRREPLVLLEGSPGYYPRFGFRPGGELGCRKPSLGRDRIGRC